MSASGPDGQRSDIGSDASLHTAESIASDLRRLGVGQGQLLMVHASLRSIGYVRGGAPTVVRALTDVLGSKGTLVMPAFTPTVSDPATWTDPVLAEHLIESARRHVLAFDPAATPTAMGAIAETFRTWPGTVRSAHPRVSVTARGPLANRIISPHALPWGQGAGSPFARLYDLNASLLLLGVGFNRATFLHFAESRVPHGRRKTRKIPVDRDGLRNWISAPDVGDDLDTFFPRIGEELVRPDLVSIGYVGQAQCAIASSRQVVDFATAFLAGALPRSAD